MTTKTLLGLVVVLPGLAAWLVLESHRPGERSIAACCAAEHGSDTRWTCARHAGWTGPSRLRLAVFAPTTVATCAHALRFITEYREEESEWNGPGQPRAGGE